MCELTVQLFLCGEYGAIFGTIFCFVCFKQINQVASLESFKLDCNISVSLNFFKEKIVTCNIFLLNYA